MKKIGSSQRLAAAFCGFFAVFLLRANLTMLEYPLVWWVIVLAVIIAIEAGIIALAGFSPLLQFSQHIGLRGTYWLGWFMCLSAFGVFLNSAWATDWLMVTLNGIFTLALFWVSVNMVSELKKNSKASPRYNILYILLLLATVIGFVFIRSHQGVLLMPAAILASAMANIALVVLLSAIMSRE